MKRTFLFVILCIILVSISGCNGSGGGKGQNSDNPQSEDQGTPQQTDTEAPSVPAKPALSASGSGGSSDPLSVQIVWQTSTDNKGVKNYRIYRNGSFLAGSTVPLFTDTGISETERYCYSVSAIDEAGNESGRSEPACFNSSAGKIKWEFRTEGDSSDSINAAPQLDSKGNIYFFDKRYVYCVKNDGTLNWKLSMDDLGGMKYNEYGGLPYNIQNAMAIGADDSIYILCGDYLHSLNPDGSLKWKIPFNDGESEKIRIAYNRISTGHDGTVYLFSYRFLQAINPDGSFKWQRERIDDLPDRMVVGADDSVYFIDDCSLVGLKPDGTVKWRIVEELIYINGISDDGTVYFSYTSVSGTDRLRILKALTPEGIEKWKIVLDDDDSVSKTGRDGTVYIRRDNSITYYYKKGTPKFPLPPPIYEKHIDFYVYSDDGVLMWNRNDFDPDNADLIMDHGIYIDTFTGIDRYNPLDGKQISHYDNILSGFTEDADGNVFVWYSEKDQSLSENVTYLKALKPDGSAQWEVPVLTANEEEMTFFKPLIGNDGTVYAVSHKKNGNKTEYSITAVYSNARSVNL